MYLMRDTVGPAEGVFCTKLARSRCRFAAAGLESWRLTSDNRCALRVRGGARWSFGLRCELVCRLCCGVRWRACVWRWWPRRPAAVAGPTTPAKRLMARPATPVVLAPELARPLAAATGPAAPRPLTLARARLRLAPAAALAAPAAVLAAPAAVLAAPAAALGAPAAVLAAPAAVLAGQARWAAAAHGSMTARQASLA
jgi:hypothetical protein